MPDPVSVAKFAGDDWVFPCTYRDAANAAINLTGFQPEGDLHIRGQQPFPLTVANGGAVLLDQAITGNRGKFRLLVDRTTTALIPWTNSLTPRTAWLRIGLVDPAGERTTLGILTILVTPS